MSNYSNDFLLVVVWFFVLIAISFFLNYFWSRIVSGKIKQVIFFPGVVVHELSHALGCIITLAKIKEIRIFSTKGSYVSHSKSKIPLIGNFIISFFPIAGGIFAVFIFSWIFGFNLPQIQLLEQSLYQNFLFFFKNAIIFISENYKLWQFWLFSYLTISIVACLAPSKKDFKNSFWGTVFLIAVLSVFIYFGIFSDCIMGFLKNPAMNVLGIGISFGLLSIIITLPIYLIKKLI